MVLVPRKAFSINTDLSRVNLIKNVRSGQEERARQPHHDSAIRTCPRFPRPFPRRRRNLSGSDGWRRPLPLMASR